MVMLVLKCRKYRKCLLGGGEVAVEFSQHQVSDSKQDAAASVKQQSKPRCNDISWQTTLELN